MFIYLAEIAACPNCFKERSAPLIKAVFMYVYGREELLFNKHI